MATDFARELHISEADAPPAGRHAALALHTMNRVDRDWVLDRLAPAQRLALMPLLAELRRLKVPVQPRWIRARSLTEPDAAKPLPDAEPDPKPLLALHRLTVDDAHALLVGEPDQLIADVLQLGRFHWRTALLERWPSRRARIERLERRVVVDGAGRRHDALVRLLADRAACRPSSPVISSSRASSSWSQQARRWLGRLEAP